MTSSTRGTERERTLPREVYFSESYFGMTQLCSFAHQINFIHSMRPTSAVEIGVGNGFVSTFLRRAGISVITVDINPALGADICAPLSEVHGLLSESPDLVICCEVLEHMPLEELDKNLDYLRGLGGRLFMTLPNFRRNWGISGFLRVPRRIKLFDVSIGPRLKKDMTDSAHFWEVDSCSRSSHKSIVARLRQRYRSVRSGKFELNPSHVYFICDDK